MTGDLANEVDVAVVGARLAGLVAARDVIAAGRSAVVAILSQSAWAYVIACARIAAGTVGAFERRVAARSSA